MKQQTQLDALLSQGYEIWQIWSSTYFLKNQSSVVVLTKTGAVRGPSKREKEQLSWS